MCGDLNVQNPEPKLGHFLNVNAIQMLHFYSFFITEILARTCEGRGAYKIFVGKPERRKPLGRPRRRWEDNIKMDLQEVRWGHGLD
jgi:hypothetical protein